MNDNKTRVWIIPRQTKKKTSYDLRWYDGTSGKFRSQCVGTDRKLADRLAAERQHKLNEGTYSEVKRVSWADFAAEHLRKLDLRSTTVADIKRTLDEFAEVCEPTSPRHVTFRMIEDYVEHLKAKGNSVATQNKRLRYVKATLNRGVKRGYLKVNVMTEWEWSREEDKIPRALNADEKAKLLAACPRGQWHTLVSVALTTGCRIGELLSLTWDRVDLGAARMVVTGTKAHKDRVQPLNTEAVEGLRKLQASTLKDGGPFRGMSYNTIAKQFRRIVEVAGIAHTVLHDLRRTFCTDLAGLGVNQLVVQKLAGHANSATTSRYYQHADDSMKREAVAKLAAG